LQFQQHIDGFLGAARGVAGQAKVAQGVYRLLQGDLAVIHHQDPRIAEHFRLFHGQVGRRRFNRRRGDAMDDFFDVQHLHQAAFHLGHPGDERTVAAGAVGRWANIGGQAVHDLAHGLHMQALLGTAHVGDDQAAAVRVFQGHFPQGATQVDHRQ